MGKSHSTGLVATQQLLGSASCCIRSHRRGQDLGIQGIRSLSPTKVVEVVAFSFYCFGVFWVWASSTAYNEVWCEKEKRALLPADPGRGTQEWAARCWRWARPAGPSGREGADLSAADGPKDSSWKSDTHPAIVAVFSPLHPLTASSRGSVSPPSALAGAWSTPLNQCLLQHQDSGICSLLSNSPDGTVV